MANVLKVACQGCGADLDVSADLRFVTCNFCGSRLEIVRDQSTTHSVLLERIEERTNVMAGDLKVIRLQNELERLDREWQSERESCLVTGQNGHRREPSAVGAVVGGIVMIIFGLAWIGFASNISGPFSLFGVVFIGMAVFVMARSLSKVGRLNSARANYEARRRKLLTELHSAQSAE